MFHETVGLIKSTPWIWKLSFAQWRAKYFHSSEHPHYLILGAMSERNNFVTQDRDLIDTGAKRILTFFFLSYFMNKASF